MAASGWLQWQWLYFQHTILTIGIEGNEMADEWAGSAAGLAAENACDACAVAREFVRDKIHSYMIRMATKARSEGITKSITGHVD